MKAFITGVGGQLGSDVINVFAQRGYECIGSDIFSHLDTQYPYVQLDIRNAANVSTTISTFNPDVVIHCAAWTSVDAAEENNYLEVNAINFSGTQNIANACKETDCKMIYISTDYVFNGQGTTPWPPDCKDFAPLNIYGQSKLNGEFAVINTIRKYFIVRSSWIFGSNGNNFVKTMINISKDTDNVFVVCDQIGTPTYTVDLSRLLADMAETEKYGYYHATNDGPYISWYDLTVEIYKQLGIFTKITPVTTEEYGLSKAKRPLNSRLDKSNLVKNGFKSLPTWQNALSRYLKEIDI